MICFKMYISKNQILLGFLLLASYVSLVRTMKYSSLDATTWSNDCSGVATPGAFYPSSKYAFPIDPTVTWMANRNTPLSSAAASLFHPYGTLELSDQNQDNICYNNSEKLVLKSINGTEAWKGFDYSLPTDTLLPGQSRHRNQSHSFVSRPKKGRKNGNPEIANDTYSFEWDAKRVLPLSWTGPEVFLNWKRRPYIGSKSPTAILSGRQDPVRKITTLKRITMFRDEDFRSLPYAINQTVTLNPLWEEVSNWRHRLGYPTVALHGTDRILYSRNLAVEKLPEPPAAKKDNKWVKILAPTVGILGVLLIIVVAIFCLWRYENVQQWLWACGRCGLCHRRPTPRYEINFPGDTPVRTEPGDGGVESEVEGRGPRCHCAVSCVMSFNHSGSREI